MRQCIDRTQRRFLREIGCTEPRALLQFRLAPLESRKDVAVLGMLHRIMLELAPPHMAILCPIIGAVLHSTGQQRLRYLIPQEIFKLSNAMAFQIRLQHAFHNFLQSEPNN